MAAQSELPISRVAIRAVLICQEIQYDVELDGTMMSRKRDLARAKQIAGDLAGLMKSPGEIRVIEIENTASA